MIQTHGAHCYAGDVLVCGRPAFHRTRAVLRAMLAERAWNQAMQTHNEPERRRALAEYRAAMLELRPASV